MEKHGRLFFFQIIGSIFRRFLSLLLSFGPMPKHIAFIMDGNRRYAKKRNLKVSSGHTVGFAALTAVLQYCYEMGVKFVTVYAFSIDNFKRKPEEVQALMDLMEQKIDELLREESIVHKYGIRLNFYGNLDLLMEPARLAAERAMEATTNNTGLVLTVCIAYTSSNEIARAVGTACARRSGYARGSISVDDLEESLDTADFPEPDIVVRTSGETRLSNFLLWQTSWSHLQKPSQLWPEFSLWNLVWCILEYQRVYHYLEATKKRIAKKNL